MDTINKFFLKLFPDYPPKQISLPGYIDPLLKYPLYVFMLVILLAIILFLT